MALTACDALEAIRSLGLTVRVADGAIKVGPPELVEAYREDLKEIISPIRQEILDYCKTVDDRFMKSALDISRQRGWGLIEKTPGQKPRILVQANPSLTKRIRQGSLL